MGPYYSNFWLTLAARLDNEISLITGPRNPTDSDIGYYRLTVPSSPVTPEHLYCTWLDELLRDNRASSFLSTRGWALQEEVLSQRFLSFQPWQTSLRVGGTGHYESGFPKHISQTGFLNMASWIWNKLVENYSKRLLKEYDKLPAISGLAQRYQQDKPDTCLAGLWPSPLLEDLSWCSNRDGRSPNRNGMALHGPSMYRAPSWSWASLDQPVIYDEGSGSLELRELTILSASTVSLGKDPFGQVQSGSLVVQSRLNKQLWRLRPNINEK